MIGRRRGAPYPVLDEPELGGGHGDVDESGPPRGTCLRQAGRAASPVVVAGMQVLERGLQCGAGRIDVVARDGDELVFCLVVTSIDGMGDGGGPEPSAPVAASALRPMAQLWLARAGLVLWVGPGPRGVSPAPPGGRSVGPPAAAPLGGRVSSAPGIAILLAGRDSCDPTNALFPVLR